MTFVTVLVCARQMPGSNDYQPWHRFRDAITISARLSSEDGDRALRIVDDAIALAIVERENEWVSYLSHHGAIISSFLGKSELVKRYYEQSLKFSPENPRALHALANVARDEGELELAKDYAARCYKSLREGDDFLKDARLESLLRDWPVPD